MGIEYCIHSVLFRAQEGIKNKNETLFSSVPSFSEEAAPTRCKVCAMDESRERPALSSGPVLKASRTLWVLGCRGGQ